MKWVYGIGALIFGGLLMAASSSSGLAITAPVRNPRMRNDNWGQGHFGAKRGNRTHQGIDLVVSPGQSIKSPVAGVVVRKAPPYPDMSYSGVLIRGTGVHEGIEVKMFYMAPHEYLIGQPVRRGQEVGKAQKVSNRYPGMTDHLHIEFRRGGRLIDPEPIIRPSK